MKQTTKQAKLSKRFIHLSLLLAVLVGSAFLVLQHNKTEAAPVAKPVISQHKSQFSFSGATNWWQGATNATSMALFHKSDGCFTSVEHKSGSVDVNSELQRQYDMQTTGGYTVTPGTVQRLTIQSETGLQKYDLHQSSVTGTGVGGKVKGGQEFGYVQLSDGYLKIVGYCDTPAQLPSTLNALQAIKFDGSIK